MRTRTPYQPTRLTWMLLTLIGILSAYLVATGAWRFPSAGGDVLPAYTISAPEHYGNPGPNIGNKFIITIAPGTPETAIRQIVQKEAEANREKKIIFGEGLSAEGFRPGRMLFQVVRSGSTRGVADYVYEWRRGLGTRLETCPYPVETDCREDD